VPISFSNRSVARIAFLTALAFLATLCAPAQQLGASAPSADRGRILLLLPFDNHTNRPNLEWVREAAAVQLSDRLRSVGFDPMSRADRVYALDHLGLPESFQPSRASALKLAQTLDADQIVVGDFTTDGSKITAEARLVDVPHLRMSEAIVASGEMRDMIAVFDSLAWKLARKLDPSFGVAEETFIAAGHNIRLEAFEQYIRGITEPDQSERLSHLQQSVKISPDLIPAWMALGREDYANQQYEQAAQAFAKVDMSGLDGLEAGYYRGLSLLFMGDYASAEHAFADVAKILPLAEVVNNQAVAISRQGKDGTSLFVQAAADDPNFPDYHFNLAVSLKRHGQGGAARNELTQFLKLHPTDIEAQDLDEAWKLNAPPSEAPDPLERIVRTFDAAAFRQAAQMLDQVDATHLATLSPLDRAQKIAGQAKGFLDRGLLLEAERLYQQAVSADNNCAEAHAGLAQVRERSGSTNAARMEAHQALALSPSAEAYLVLARLDLAADHFDDAASEAAAALKLEPGNPVAQDMVRRTRAQMPQKQ
jgi:tetratricopeptide (TPR) repeat protein